MLTRYGSRLNNCLIPTCGRAIDSTPPSFPPSFQRFYSSQRRATIDSKNAPPQTPSTSESELSDSSSSALSALFSLLPPIQRSDSPPPTSESSPRIHELYKASLEPKISFYDPKESPAGRWFHRNRLGTVSKRPIEEGHQPSDPEIVWRSHHRSLLQLPHPSGFKDRSTFEYVSRRSMRSYAQILTTPTADTQGTTILLHFDDKRYLIGSMAEGTQRACVQMGTRLLKVGDCFITGRTEWKNTGGLIGMILTLADSINSSDASSHEEAMRKVHTKAKKMGVLDDPHKMRELEDGAAKEVNGNLSIFGPPNLNHTLATARRFVFRKGLPVNVHEIRDVAMPASEEPKDHEWKPFWADDNVKVWAMSISPSPKVPTSPRSKSTSPRKRSFDEMRADGQSTVNVVNGELSQEERDYLEVKAVVGEMFNSSWRLDTLHETPLSQVDLPATIFIRNPETNKIEKYTGPLPNNVSNPPPDPQLKVLIRKPWPGALVERLPATKPALEAISYIFKNHMQRGKFRVDKAKALKVKHGHDYAKLSRGESVFNEDGETVTPDQILDPPRIGGGMAVVDLPGPEYIDELVARPEWRSQQIMEGVGAVIWICGKGVATDSRLHNFMLELGHLKHVLSSPDYCSNNIALDSVAASTVKLRQVDPDRYSVPVHDAEEEGPQIYGGNADYLKLRASHPLPGHVNIAARGQKLQLEPTLEFQTADVVAPLNVPGAAAEVTENVLQEARKAHEVSRQPDIQTFKWLSTLPPGADQAEVITLGTGSAIPSKYRNVSATLVRVPQWGNILFDAGENTLGQLKRVFPPEEFKQVLRDLRLLIISHMHADHHLGTASVIKAWYKERHACQPAEAIPTDGQSELDWSQIMGKAERLAVLAESAMQHWLYEYSFVEDFGYSRMAPLNLTLADLRKDPATSSKLSWFIPAGQLKALDKTQRAQRLQQYIVPKSCLDLQDVQAAPVRHCQGARAVSITLPSGFKASYSGDCRPSKHFAQIGKNSTICIHEATFDDELQGDAEAKQHSTTSEALDIAQKMNARACVLTHFSQRYQKVPVLERESGELELAEDITMEKNASADVDEVATSQQPSAENDDAAPADSFPDTTATNSVPYVPSAATAADSSGGSAAATVVKVKSDMKVAVAFDYMRVKIGDMWKMEKFTPALLKLFAEEEAEREKERDSKTKALAAEGVKRRKGKGKNKGREE